MGRGLDGYLISVHWHCVVLKARGGWAQSLTALCSDKSSISPKAIAVRRLPGLSPVSGGYGEGETPLPIPNREVKPLSADGTWPARAWESRSPPVLT